MKRPKEINTITLETYDKKGRLESISFTVPVEWATIKIKEIFKMNIGEFIDSYIWDDSEHLYNIAKGEGVLQF